MAHSWSFRPCHLVFIFILVVMPWESGRPMKKALSSVLRIERVAGSGRATNAQNRFYAIAHRLAWLLPKSS